MEQFNMNFAAPFFERKAVQKIAGWIADRHEKSNLTLPVATQAMTDEDEGLPLLRDASAKLVRAFVWMKSEEILSLLKEGCDVNLSSLHDAFSDLPQLDLEETELILILDPIEEAADFCFEKYVEGKKVTDEDVANALKESSQVGDKSEGFYEGFVKNHRAEILCITGKKILCQAKKTLKSLIVDSSSQESSIDPPTPDSVDVPPPKQPDS